MSCGQEVEHAWWWNGNKSSANPSPKHTEDEEEKVREILGVMNAASHMDYIGEAVSQLEHGLQGAKFAADSGKKDPTGSLTHFLSTRCRRALFFFFFS